MSIDKKLADLTQKYVEFGKSSGASQVEITIQRGRNVSVEVREGNIETLQQAGSKSLGIKVIVDNKSATASTSDFTDDTVKGMIKNAISRAKLGSEDPFAGFAEKSSAPADWEKLGIYDPEIENVQTDLLVKKSKELEKIAAGKSKIEKSMGSSSGTGIFEFFIANSNGASGQYKNSSIYSGIYLEAGKEPDIFQDGYYASKRYLKDLPSLEEIAEKAAFKATRLLGAKKIKTQNVPVIFDNTVASSILSFLVECISGGSIYRKQSFLVDKLNSQIAANLLNIVDDAHLFKGLGTKPIDGEGTPTSKLKIIENGILKSYLLGIYSGKKLNMKSTGHGSGANNLYIEKGQHSQQEIIKSIDKGLLVTNLMGQGTVPTSGDISKGASGLWIEKGEIVYPVNEITITSNLGKMLNELEMVGNDLEFRGSINSPSLKFKEMTIAGK